MIHHFIRLLSFISCDYSPTRAVLYVPLYHFPGVGGVGPNGKKFVLRFFISNDRSDLFFFSFARPSI